MADMTYKPAKGYSEQPCDAGYENPPYCITTYALAVKHGFQGTFEEWRESLKGVDVVDITIREV